MDLHKNGLHIFANMRALVRARYFFALYIFLSLLLMPAGLLWANGYTMETVSRPLERDGTVKLMATLQDSPAFKDVMWKLYRRNLPGRPVKTIKRHAATINLKPGHYRVVAVLGSIVRNHSFELKSSEITEVILSMDK